MSLLRLLSILSALAVPAVANAADLWPEPWSVNAVAPVTPEAGKVQKAKPAPPVRQTSLPKIFLLGAVRFYQVGISPADGASCNLYPTCSGYAVHALRKQGPIVGFVMTAERVMRNHVGEHYPTIYKFGRWRNHDPVEANDFWFPWEKARRARERELRTMLSLEQRTAAGIPMPKTAEVPR